MKKLLVLLFVAAAVGIIISRGKGDQPEPGGAAGPAVSSATDGAADPAPAPPPQRPPERVIVQAPAPAPAAAAGGVAAPARPEPARAAAEPPAPRPVLLSATAPAPSDPAPSAQAGPVPALSAAARVTPSEAAAADVVAQAVQEALVLVRQNRRIEARAILTRLYLASRGQRAAKLREALDSINKELVFSPRTTEGATVHVVQPGDMYVNLGKKYNVNWRMIERINGIPPDRLRAGQSLKILTGRTSLIAYKGEFRMALLIDGAFIKEYRIGIGKEDLTPAGEFVVEDMMEHPAWTTPEGRVIRYGEPGYLLGERWIGFADQPGASGLGIHGTNDETTVGSKSSNGCLRLRNADVIELYDFVQLGSKVRIVD